MLLTMPPISKTIGSAADISAIVHFLYLKHGSFYYMDSSNLFTGTQKFPSES